MQMWHLPEIIWKSNRQYIKNAEDSDLREASKCLGLLCVQYNGKSCLSTFIEISNENHIMWNLFSNPK